MWDINPAGPALVASQPTFRIPSTYKGKSLNNTADPNNIQTVFESVEISRDGRVLALGCEASNEVMLFSLPVST